MKKEPVITRVTIGQYRDYFSYDKNLETGVEVLKLDGKEVNPDDYRDILDCVFPKWIHEELSTNLNKGN